MSWANVRGSLVDAIEALTPTTTTIGERQYTYLGRRDIERSSHDRCFTLELAAPPQAVVEALDTDQVWQTRWRLSIYYDECATLEQEDDRIAEDVMQVSAALLNLGNYHADAHGPVAGGAKWFETAITGIQGGTLVEISGTVQHT
jgi:hypothetical protein